MSDPKDKKTKHDEALGPYEYYTELSPLGNWGVFSPQREQPLCLFPDERSAIAVALTLNVEYSSLYDKGWERGYDVGYGLAVKTSVALDGPVDYWQPDGHGPMSPPPGDE